MMTVYQSLPGTARKTLFDRAGKINPPPPGSSSYKEGNEFLSEYLIGHASEKCDLDEITTGLKKVPYFNLSYICWFKIYL